MGINVITDHETELAESFRQSRKYPLPPEISVNGEAPAYFDMLRKYEMYGLSKYRTARLILNNRINRGYSVALQTSAVSYVDRLGHVLSSVYPDDPVSYSDLHFLSVSPSVGPPPNHVVYPSGSCAAATVVQEGPEPVAGALLGQRVSVGTEGTAEVLK